MAIEVLTGLLLALIVSAVTAPVGISGAVFLVPVQLSLLNTPSLLVTPTNLLYNVVAIPGALFRYSRNQSLWTPLTRLLVCGTAPGVVVGAIIRSQFLDGPDSFYLVVAAVLAPLGAWMLLFDPPLPHPERDPASSGFVLTLSLAVGVVGGIYGIGGGSILAPVLVGLGFSVAAVAPAALTATFATSIIGIVSFVLIGIQSGESLAPDWRIGLALGAGGLLGSFVGASVQPRLPEHLLRRLLGLLALALAAWYTWQAIA